MNAPQFTATQFYSVEHKEKLFKHFLQFYRKGCPKTLFYKWFYVDLSNMFGNIAEYNRDTFYENHFSDAEKRTQFLKYCLSRPIYGDPAWTRSDVEAALKPEIEKILFPLTA